MGKQNDRSCGASRRSCIAHPARYLKVVRTALHVAHAADRSFAGHSASRLKPDLGTSNARAEKRSTPGCSLFFVRRFTEKTGSDAREIVSSENTSGTRISSGAYRHSWEISKVLAKTHDALMRLRRNRPALRSKHSRAFTQLENISVDYAILEPAASRNTAPSVFVLPAEVGWSISAPGPPLRVARAKSGENVSPALFLARCGGNFLWSPRNSSPQSEFTISSSSNEDALLLCPRDRAQNVGKIVKWLELRSYRACCEPAPF